MTSRPPARASWSAVGGAARRVSLDAAEHERRPGKGDDTVGISTAGGSRRGGRERRHRWAVPFWRHARCAQCAAGAGVHPGAIVLVHDIHPTTVPAVPGLIDALQYQGDLLLGSIVLGEADR